MFGYEPKMSIRRDFEGIWQLRTGAYLADPIPHPTWVDAYNHARFIYRINHGEA